MSDRVDLAGVKAQSKELTWVPTLQMSTKKSNVSQRITVLDAEHD